jgi:hypothetical protein
MEYLEARAKFASDIAKPDLFDFIDHWQLYVGQENLSRFLTIYDVLKGLGGIPGDVAELGCWQGANLVGMSKILQYLNQNGTKKVYGFDSFEGLTNPVVEDNFDDNFRGKYKGDLNKLRAAINLYGFDSSVLLIPGLIEDTVPEFINENPETRFSLIYYDADFYAPAEIMFQYLVPRLSVGGVILLDEYGTPEWPGETKSVNEFLLNSKHFVSENIVTAKQPTLMITRIS